MIQTSYVSLERPYRIIEYSGTVGLQIGTLVVTRETEGADGGYGIETHSHPVVSYANPQVERKQMGQNVYNGFSSGQVEGVVWDKVEVSEVVTLGREGDSISWNDLMDNCRNLWYVGKWDNEDMGLLKLGEFWNSIERLGLTIVCPKDMMKYTMVMHVGLIRTEYKGISYCQTKSGLGLIIPFADDEEMFKNLIIQLRVYETLMQIQHVALGLVVRFNTEEESLAQLVDSLNEEQQREKNRAPMRNFWEDDLYREDDLDWEEVGVEEEKEKKSI